MSYAKDRARGGLRRNLAVLAAAAALLPLAATAALLEAVGIRDSAALAALGGLALVAPAVAAVLGARAGHRLADRIARIQESAQRISAQDFGGEVLPAPGNDEIARLTRTFNEMARNLESAIAVHGILAQMDDAVLTKLDIGTMVRGALRGVCSALHAELAVLGLYESDDGPALRIFWMRKKSRGSVESRRISLEPEAIRRLDAVQALQTTAQPPFPPDLLEEFVRRGAAHFFLLPVAHGDRIWGVLAAGYRSAASIAPPEAEWLRSIAARLVAGFRGAERERQLHLLTFVDPITALPNRTAVEATLPERLAQARESGAMAALLHLDLDRFKQINDVYGHHFGDRVLNQVANRLRNQVREEDLLARLGADEFLVLLTGLRDEREAGSAARKLIRVLSHGFEIDGVESYTGASIGITMFPKDGEDWPDLSKKADLAMNSAKNAGRNRLAFYEPSMNREVERQAVLDVELRNALERREFVLHYQPQIDLATGSLFGVEALVRWRHPVRGLLLPGEFIFHAERIGLIPEIGSWVLMEACLQYARWRQDGMRVPRVSVNVSNGQLPRTNFVPTVRKILKTTSVPAQALEIEVTESMLIEGGQTAEALETLASDGVTIALDDFGTGYSSFQYLKTMPARVLKLDISFLVDARPDNDAGRIVGAIVNMAHALHKEVVAEGVEREEQLNLLKALGCERGQGYLFGKPVPAEQIASAFGSRRGRTGESEASTGAGDRVVPEDGG